MRLVDDPVEYERLMGTGAWFEHPNDAKKLRESYEKRIQDGQKPNECEQPAKQVASGAQRKKRVRKITANESSEDGRQSA